VSWQSTGFNTALRFFFKRRVARGTALEQKAAMNALLERAAVHVGVPRGVVSRTERVGGVHCQFAKAEGVADDAPVLLYLHGGAFMCGSARTHLNLAARLAMAANARVMLVDYRLTPDHVYPAPIEDLTTVYRLILESGIKSSSIAFGGDSAGANIALATLQKLPTLALPPPAACVLISPWLDLTLSGASTVDNAGRDSMVPVSLLRNAARLYAADLDPAHPGLSPLFASMRGMPPLMIQVSSDEILFHDALRLSQKAEAAGVSVVYRVWSGQAHGFPALAPYVPESVRSIKEIGDFLRSAFS